MPGLSCRTCSTGSSFGGVGKGGGITACLVGVETVREDDEPVISISGDTQGGVYVELMAFC